MSSPYLTAARERFNATQASLDAIQARAADEARELTDDEMRSVEGLVATSKKIFAEVETLEASEVRASQVSKFASAAGSRPVAGIVGDMRDPGHYRSATDGGQHSWFADGLAAKRGDSAAIERLRSQNEYARAHQTTTTAAGNVPPAWLTDAFTVFTQQGRKLAAAVPNFALSDARPFSLPGVTANSSVSVSDTENTAVSPTDSFTSAAVSITPQVIVGSEVISRQLLDAGMPAVDQIILQSLSESYNTKVEALVCAAVKAAGPSAITVTSSEWLDFTTVATYGPTILNQAAMAVYAAKFSRPDILVCDYDFYQALLNLADSTGRPLVTNAFAAPQNNLGIGGAGAMQATDGWVQGMRIVVTNGMIAASHAYAAAIYSADVQLFEMAPRLYELQEKLGPASIELDLWGYAQAAVRNSTRPVQNVIYTVG